MRPTDEPRVYPARERWFWVGVGFVSAFAILLLGLISATILTAREAGKPLTRQVAAPASPRNSPPALSPRPSISQSPPNGSTAVPAKPRADEAHPVPKPKAVDARGMTAPVRIVEKPGRPPAAAAKAKTSPASGAAPAKLASRPASASPDRSPPASPRPSPSEQVGGSREEWGRRSADNRVEVIIDRGRDVRRGSEDDEQAGSARGTAPPELVEGRDAEYPISAMAEGVTGTVRVRIVVGPEGLVERATVARSSGDARLDAAATRAALLWRYRPGRRGGRAVVGVDTATFEFYRDDH